MPSDVTAIMNMGLDLLEEEPVLSPDDDRAAVRWMNRNFGPVRDYTLRLHPWNFALARASLPALAEAPAFGWTYQYQLPGDCLRVLPLADLGLFNGTLVSFEVEGRRILTDITAPLHIRYIKQITDTSLFDPMFVQVLAAQLASRAASWLTGKQGYADRLQQTAAGLLLQAQMVDALEGTPEEPVGDLWTEGRFSGVRG